MAAIKPVGPVTLPRRSRAGLDLLPWCKEVDRALQQLRDRPFSIFKSSNPGGGGSSGPCSFGEIITIPNTDPAETGIRGGVIYCGDQNWNMDPQTIDLETDGVWLVYLTIPVEVNRDDDGEILLPGILTGTRPTGDWDKTAWTSGTDYPDSTPPEASDGAGEIIVPLGKLTIADGAATFDPAGCGNITITHCAGMLGHTRG